MAARRPAAESQGVTEYGYDGFDRLARTTFGLGTYEQASESYSYDASDNLLTRATRRGDTLRFAYDRLNRLTSKTAAAAPVACSAASSATPTVSYSYDLAGRLTGVCDNGAAIQPVSLPAGWPGAVAYAGATGFDALNRPRQASWDGVAVASAPASAAAGFAHGYNRANQRTAQQATDDGWWYVPAGIAAPQASFAYGYDAESRLVSATAAGMTAVYDYDAQGRRKQKTVNGARTVYVTDAENREVLEYDGASGAPLRGYAFGSGLDAVLAQVDIAAAHTDSNPRSTMIADLQGSIVGTVDSASGAVTKTGYQPFGESATTAGTYRYTGRRIDAETGGLYYYRARMYDPIAGRFLQQDPVRYAGGPNLYAYVANDPLNFTDPFGLSSSPAGNALGYGLNQAYSLLPDSLAAKARWRRGGERRSRLRARLQPGKPAETAA